MTLLTHRQISNWIVGIDVIQAAGIKNENVSFIVINEKNLTRNIISLLITQTAASGASELARGIDFHHQAWMLDFFNSKYHDIEILLNGENGSGGLLDILNNSRHNIITATASVCGVIFQGAGYTTIEGMQIYKMSLTLTTQTGKL